MGDGRFDIKRKRKDNKRFIGKSYLPPEAPRKNRHRGSILARIILKPRKAQPFYARHPWVLASAVERIEGKIENGDEAELFSDKGKFIARGLYNANSHIRMRLYSWIEAERLDDQFFASRLRRAVQFRKELGYDDPNGAARLVFSEGDGLSGLIVDRYADCLVVQVTALAMEKRLSGLVPQLLETTGAKGVVVRTEKGIAIAEGITLKDDSLELLRAGQTPETPVEFLDGGLRFTADVSTGQKTGYYLDQRENRKAAAGYTRGRNVLDMFCFNGGFALAAALGGAKEVLGVDSSKKAIAQAEENAQRNGASNARFQVGEGFETLEQFASEGRRFDGIILDPPKFAQSRKTLNDAMRAYHWLNRLALNVLEPGGILVTCSCSGRVTREDFLDMLVGVAQHTHREIQILEQRGASPDHPTLTSCLDGEYLKCVICRAL